ncbi:hypothetical protein E2C01_102863 [Portunus trituberculatus]|uniref:Uncharacterized protein n=1 Tax=Portunus trituberculatus TaxID=210409 RepID=A0A5B7K9B7_PORTR|nr:hypothetical protein [Portunus trituberculatus]
MIFNFRHFQSRPLESHRATHTNRYNRCQSVTGTRGEDGDTCARRANSKRREEKEEEEEEDEEEEDEEEEVKGHM